MVDTSHTVTDQEIADVEALGFQITTGNISCAEFLNEQFPGFQLAEYLKAMDTLLSPLTPAEIEKELSYHESPPPMLIIQYFSKDHADDEKGLAFSQALLCQGNERIAELDFLRIPLNFRRQGVSKKLLNLNLQQYERMGVDKIRLEAALSNGGLVWAKAFFAAIDPKEVKAILDKAEKELTLNQFKFVKRVYDNYYKKFPDGNAFPIIKWSQLSGMDQILKGSRWHGELDLNNSEMLTKFKNYVA